MPALFVEQRSIVRTIWGNPELVLLIFAGSAAEFALNRAVDWLFYTNEIPRDPIGRLFSTVRYAQEIVFSDEDRALRAIDRISQIHSEVERRRGQSIPDWAYRDVLYMLIDYSERAHRLLYGPLSMAERQELYEVFRRVGAGLRIPSLPESYAEWRPDRKLHLDRDLICSNHTKLLFKQYRRHLGPWRYEVLLQVQAQVVPDEVRKLLGLTRVDLLSQLIRAYGVVERLSLQWLVEGVLIPPQYWGRVRELDRGTG
ncbi:MAG TPA: oxygenase MpaB family protein [Blastocatellia bacterium]|nr:oxygenase MpaB family protein [Blastocatellia bacterium]